MEIFSNTPHAYVCNGGDVKMRHAARTVHVLLADPACADPKADALHRVNVVCMQKREGEREKEGGTAREISSWGETRNIVPFSCTVELVR